MLHSKPSERVWFRRNDRARFVASESGRFLVMYSLSFSLVLGPPLANARPSRREGEITRGNLCRHQCPSGEVGPSGPGEGNAVCQQVHCDARKDPLPPLRRRPPPLRRGRGDAFCSLLPYARRPQPPCRPWGLADPRYARVVIDPRHPATL